MSWQDRVAQKQAHIIENSSILSEEELRITQDYTAADLLHKLADGTLTSVAVTRSYCKRAAIAQQLGTLERAQFLDDYLKREKRVFGPLHGLPISLKDGFNIKGIQTTLGYVSFLDHPLPDKNSALVDLLLDLGAVLYVKTNIPMTMMTADSDNNLFGRVLNPHNLALTAGGSSGGEGALLALRGSPLGVGTDIAGSIRIPALCCGTYGFKPTAGRVPFGGIKSAAASGLPGVTPCAGPLANSVFDLEVFFKLALAAHPWKYDSSALDLPWRRIRHSTSLDEKLTIGVLGEDPSFPLHPPVQRVLNEASNTLRRAGHKVIPITPNQIASISAACTLAFEFFNIDPDQTALRHIAASGEPKIKSIPHNLPTGEPKKAASIRDIAALNIRQKEVASEWHRIFVSNQLDAILAPGAHCTAVPHDTFGVPPYTTIWNLLDYPACIIPYSNVSKELDPIRSDLNTLPKATKYDPELLDGVPCAVQIITPRFKDEECLIIAQIVDKNLKS
ncbi:amidase signature domain-containing protein [Xylogone sp. PMI_703]|nr:amidase signature domain-containing protein [Xylogone sp. PMI_703]